MILTVTYLLRNGERELAKEDFIADTVEETRDSSFLTIKNGKRLVAKLRANEVLSTNMEESMGKAEAEYEKQQAANEAVTAKKRPVELLICKCKDCTHWEIVKDVDQLSILCKTCGIEVPIRFDFDDHESLHWANTSGDDRSYSRGAGCFFGTVRGVCAVPASKREEIEWLLLNYKSFSITLMEPAARRMCSARITPHHTGDWRALVIQTFIRKILSQSKYFSASTISKMRPTDASKLGSGERSFHCHTAFRWRSASIK